MAGTIGAGRFLSEGAIPMEGKKDELKGRVKEAAGDLTDDESLKAEGKADRAGGKVKEFLEDAKDKGEEIVDKVKDKIDRDR
jgi:uncharacterized protein YjbJ (UPF0337 family)